MAIDVEAFYRRYGPMVLRRCRRLLADESLALDAMHDVFVQIMLREQQLQATAPSSLLFRIATHVCLNRLRATARQARRDDLLGRIATAADPAPQSDARVELAQIFEGQPDSTRVMAVLHLLDGLTLDEVAREVGLSVSGVRKRLRKLRTHVEELGGV